MKTGKSLQELAVELDRQVKSRKDFIAATAVLEAHVDEGRVKLGGFNGGGHDLTEYAHGQMAESLSIPKKYYDRMKVLAPELLANNVNHWFKAEPQRRLIRTLDNKVRAVLSDKYRPLDNFDLAQVALPIFSEQGAQVVSAELTERRLYLKTTLPSMRAEIGASRQQGDIVEAGLVISNSEVGAGALRVEPMIFRLVCKNGMIAADATMRKYHIGKAAGGADGIFEYLTDETRRADDKAFWLKVRDVVRGAFNRDLFDTLVRKIEATAAEQIGEIKLDKFVENVTSKFSLPEGSREGILRNLIEGGDLSQWGTVNAITRTSQDIEDYDQATDFERAGGKVLELSPNDWKEIAA